MRKPPHKASFRCPSCGFVQLEPPHLISTYCRACGDYYEVSRGGAHHRKLKPSAIPLDKQAEYRKKVFCHRCGATHPVSSHARSTICPGCNTAIELKDVLFNSHASVPVDTRGNLFIGPQGSLTNSWIICGSARIEGQVTGVLRSEGEVHIATTRRCVCQITAPVVFIEKHAAAAFIQPIDTDHLIVRGHLTAVVNCRGTVHVLRGGRLDAEIRARGIVVDKGGTLLGDCLINERQPAGHGVHAQGKHPKEISPFFGAVHPCPTY